MSENALAEIDWLVEAAKSARLHELARSVPERPSRTPGRRKEHPAFVGLLYVLLAGGVTGSHRSAATLLASERAWRLVRLAARRAAGEDLSRKPPRRGQLETWRGCLSEHVGPLRERAADLAVAQAIEAGCFDGTGAPADPKRHNMIVGDGKVVACPVLSKTADRWREQGRPLDVALHKQAGEDSDAYVTGSKFALIGVRASDARNARILLDVAHLPSAKGYGGESGKAVEMVEDALRRVRELDGDVDGVCYDGAFRGKHIDRMMKHGLVVLSPVNRMTGAPTPFEIVADCPCGRRHQLATLNGDLHESRELDTGDVHYTRLARKRLAKRRNDKPPHACRWYQDFVLPCGKTLTIRLDNTDEDCAVRKPRAERIRQHAPEGGVYQDRYGWREDSESWNNIVDRTLYGERMIAHTWRKQLLFMIGHMLARNVLAQHAIDRERLRPTA
ncbi:hypothetical protein [Segniliparus rugosus]|uniref:Transposase n=1 Tax=Segniliparus rugosus (strain ATCC BAA-974 / DSM 45345 / CCUG 50838 / CIP 108380 / JCM 13579 / CDC 945) TaxID=679197 RepID=E5XKP7_SEGRC|nr:hypothetical protein [Segniliparus rugosus]EFV15094.2 hypothetical protein HMPREF9336_00066 [Segniliparus rugosus ATCC BAA-974]